MIPPESVHVRSVTYTPDEHTWRHGQKLNARIAELGRQRTNGEGAGAIDGKHTTVRRGHPAIGGRQIISLP